MAKKLELDLLITKRQTVEFDPLLVRDLIEDYFLKMAPDFAEMALTEHGRQTRPGSGALVAVDAYYRGMTQNWEVVLDHYYVYEHARDKLPEALRTLDAKAGEEWAEGDRKEFYRERDAAGWTELLGLKVKCPTFSEAVKMYEDRINDEKDPG